MYVCVYIHVYTYYVMCNVCIYIYIYCVCIYIYIYIYTLQCYGKAVGRVVRRTACVGDRAFRGWIAPCRGVFTGARLPLLLLLLLLLLLRRAIVHMPPLKLLSLWHLWCYQRGKECLTKQVWTSFYRYDISLADSGSIWNTVCNVSKNSQPPFLKPLFMYSPEHVRIHVYVYIYIYIYIHMYNIYIYIYIIVNMYMYVCIYIYIYSYCMI